MEFYWSMYMFFFFFFSPIVPPLKFTVTGRKKSSLFLFTGLSFCDCVLVLANLFSSIVIVCEILISIYLIDR